MGRKSNCVKVCIRIDFGWQEKYFSILLYFSFYFHTFRMLIKLTLYEKNYFFYYGNLYFLEAETTTIEHVSIPLTNSQLLELFRNMSPLAQTRVAVFNLLTEGEVEFWSTEGPGVLVMYFTAPWKGPCKRYRLIFEKVANDYTNKECHFGRIDIDQAGEDIATKYGVNTLPTTLIIKNNKIVAKAVGLIREETLRALVNQYKA